MTAKEGTCQWTNLSRDSNGTISATYNKKMLDSNSDSRAKVTSEDNWGDPNRREVIRGMKSWTRG